MRCASVPEGTHPFNAVPQLLSAVASLEDHAIQRDKRFLIRLVLLLSVGLIFGLFVFDHLTGSAVANCAARNMGG